MSDMHPLSGAYAVDALDDLERARFERHLAECPDCTAEVASLREAAAMLAHVRRHRPQCRAARQGARRDLAPSARCPRRPRAQEVVRRHARRFPRLVAAAVAAVVLAAGVVADRRGIPGTATSPGSRRSPPR